MDTIMGMFYMALLFEAIMKLFQAQWKSLINKNIQTLMVSAHKKTHKKWWVLLIKKIYLLGPPQLLQGPLWPPFIPSFAHAVKVHIFLQILIPFKCPQGQVCVYLLMIVDLKPINISLDPLNPLEEIPWLILYYII